MKINGNRKMPHGNLPIYEKTCYGSGMKTDYEKAIEWLNKKAEKAGGITNLGKTVGPGLDVFPCAQGRIASRSRQAAGLDFPARRENRIP
jgi:hypothetical protein